MICDYDICIPKCFFFEGIVANLRDPLILTASLGSGKCQVKKVF